MTAVVPRALAEQLEADLRRRIHARALDELAPLLARLTKSGRGPEAIQAAWEAAVNRLLAEEVASALRKLRALAAEGTA
jgi:hypothetical protein